MQAKFYIIATDGLAHFDYQREINFIPRIGESITYYSLFLKDSNGNSQIYAKVIDVIHVYTDDEVKIVVEPYDNQEPHNYLSNKNNSLEEQNNDEMKKYKVTVSDHYGSTRVMVISGTSRRNIFKQLKKMIDEGDAFLNPIVEEI